MIFTSSPEVIARIYYPDEGSRILIQSGLSKLWFEKALFHELGHLFAWYLSNGKQSEIEDKREAIAINLSEQLLNLKEKI